MKKKLVAFAAFALTLIPTPAMATIDPELREMLNKEIYYYMPKIIVNNPSGDSGSNGGNSGGSGSYDPIVGGTVAELAIDAYNKYHTAGNCNVNNAITADGMPANPNEWCSDFVRWIYMKAGIQRAVNATDSAAKSWKNAATNGQGGLIWHSGLDGIQSGDVMVWGVTHVAIYVGGSIGVVNPNGSGPGEWCLNSYSLSTPYAQSADGYVRYTGG